LGETEAARMRAGGRDEINMLGKSRNGDIRIAIKELLDYCLFQGVKAKARKTPTLLPTAN